MFLDAKKIEGCSERTLQYYRVTVERMLQSTTTPIRKICTEEIRSYLSGYQQINGCGKVTVDNIRRNISSFFSWLEEEDYILKSPMRRIHKIKTKQQVKETISDEAIEQLRDHCACARDLAMIDLLYSTGIRVGELVNLNIDDVNFEARECVVFGKGDKERRVYFDAKAKLHLQNYIISSGLKEMIEGTSVAKNGAFKKIYASSFYYNERGVAVWPAQVINYTNKTQFLFRIEKGVLDINDSGVNDYFTPDNMRIPFRNMIYIGDSDTDIPCMKLVNSYGGHSIGVYNADTQDKKKVYKMMHDKRIKYFAAADYSEGRELDTLVKAIIDRTAYNEKLETMHYKNLNEAAASEEK